MDFTEVYRFIGNSYPVGIALMFGFLIAVRHSDKHTRKKDDFLIPDNWSDGSQKFVLIILGSILWPLTAVASSFIATRAIYLGVTGAVKSAVLYFIKPKPNPEWITREEARTYAREYAAQYIRENMASQDAVKKLVQQQVQAYQKDMRENVLPNLVRHELLNTHIPGLDLAKRTIDVD
jgi:hypothetical protein